MSGNQQAKEVLRAAIRRLKRTQKFAKSRNLDAAIIYAERALKEIGEGNNDTGTSKMVE